MTLKPNSASRANDFHCPFRSRKVRNKCYKRSNISGGGGTNVKAHKLVVGQVDTVQ
jgi:hypothetical protein